MGGKTGTTTQQSTVSIPPEVLARYNAVNARAETTAQQPFTPYGGEFVAPLTGTQQAGISNINQAQGISGPYYDAAGQAMTAGYQSAQPYYGAATSSMMGGQQNANILQGEASQGINQAYYGAQPYQQAATYGLGQAYAGAQPYQGIATGLGLASAAAVNPEALTGQNINQYMSPYVQNVVGTTMANLRQQQGQEQSQLLGNQITSGAFGGDRGRIAQANLARQQELATGQTVAGLMNQGYGQALQTAQQQQGMQLSAEQANRAALAGAGQQLGALGQQGFGQGVTTAQQLAALGQQGFGQGMTAAQQQAALGQQAFAQGAQGAQTYQGLGQGLASLGQEYGKNVAGLGAQAQQSALQGAQAQLGAGTVEQQTQQALNTANYNQFLQQQGYPFQIAQFLANIAMGTGALSGSTTNAATTSPQSFFSDRRLKDDIEKIGKTFDGQDIVRYKYKGEPGTRIGLIAQDVEKHNPDAVGSSDGYRTVDYDKATDKAAERGHFASGGLAGGYSSEGGAVMPEMAGMGFAAGGSPDINSMMAQILNAHQGMYPFGGAGLYGHTNSRAGAYGTEHMQTPSRGLMRAELVRASEQPGAGGQAMQGLNAARGIGSAYTEGSSALFGSAPTRGNPEGTRGLFGNAGDPSLSQGRIGRALSREEAPARPTESSAPSAETPVADAAPADGGSDYEIGGSGGDFYTGGLVRGHYAMGGLPFSEAGGYIPESVLKDDETEKNKKAMQGLSAGTAPGGGQSGSGGGLLGGLGQIGGAIGGIKALGSAGSSIGSALGIGEAAAGVGEAAAGAAGAGEAISSILPMLAMFSDRRLKDDIEKIGKTFDGQDIVRYKYKGEPGTRIGLIAQDVEKHHPDAVGMSSGYRTVDYDKATDDAAKRGHFASGGLAGMRHGYALDGEVSANQEGMAGLAGLEGGLGRANDNSLEVERIVNSLGAIESGRRGDYGALGTEVRRAGREPDRAHGRYQVMGENIGPWTEAAIGQRLSPQEFLANQTAQEDVVRHRVQQDLNRYGNARDVASRWFSGRPVAQAGNVQDPNGVGVPEYLRRFDEAYGSYSSGAGLGAPAAAEAAGQRTPAAAPASTNGLGAAQYTGDGGGDTQSTDRAAERQQRAGVNFNYPRERSEPNWLQRNQDWLVPVLSGLGAMASSPSRHLGSALLQGVAGGAQQYASMQNKAEEQQAQRGQLEVAQENARTTSLREETAARQAALQVLDHFDRRYRREITSEGPRFIDLTGGPALTVEQHAQRRATVLNSLMAGVDSARALSTAQARPAQTTQGSVEAPARVTTGAAPAGTGITAATEPAGAGVITGVGTTSGTGIPPEGATSTGAGISTEGRTGVGTSTPPAAAGTPAVAPSAPAQPAQPSQLTPPAAFAPVNEQDRAAYAEAIRLLQPDIDKIAGYDRQIDEISRTEGIRNVPPSLQQRRDNLYAEVQKQLRGEATIPNPGGAPNDYFERQRNIAVRREEEQKAHDAEVNAFEQNSPAVTSSLRNVAGLLRTTPTGAATAALATFSSILRSLPATSGISGETLRNIQSANEVIRTTAMRQALDTLKNNPGTLPRSNMSLLDALATVVSSDKGPEGNFEVLTDALADDARTRAFNEAARNKPPHMPMGQFREQWNRDPANSREGYIANIRREMPGFAGMNHASRQRLGTADAQIPANLRDQNGNPFGGINVGQGPNGPIFQVNIQGRPPQYYNSRGEPIPDPTRQTAPAPAAAP